MACTHLELIGWLKALSNPWPGFAAVSGNLGQSIFLNTMAPKTNAEIPAANAEMSNAEIHEVKSNVVFGFESRCFGPPVGTDMLHLYLKHPQAFYISHASLDLGCLALLLQN